jgi:hypothetical protein
MLKQTLIERSRSSQVISGAMAGKSSMKTNALMTNWAVSHLAESRQPLVQFIMSLFGIQLVGYHVNEDLPAEERYLAAF